MKNELRAGRLRARDRALYAPLVLLAFAWFATTACLGLFDSPSPPPSYTPSGPPPTVMYDPVDGMTKYTSAGGGQISCDGGTYRGGGNPGASESIKNQFRNEIAESNRKAEEYESKVKACGGRPKALSDFEREAGCKRSRIGELFNAANNASSLEESQRLRAQMDAMDAACKTADFNYTYSNCSPSNFGYAQDTARFYRAQAGRKQADLNQFEACDNDRVRQARANQPQGGSGIDPGVLIFSNPGLFGGRRPAPSNHGTGGHHKE